MLDFKTRSFKLVYWVMVLFLIGDTLDTMYRFVSGYLNTGSSFPGVNVVIQPTTIDLIVFLVIQAGVVYGIYLLYSLRKIGGYWFMGSQIVFLVYASLFGPISKIGVSAIILPLLFFMLVYVVLVIFVPLIYSDKFQ